MNKNSVEQKLEILNEYGIKEDTEIGKEIETMCNLSQDIKEEASIITYIATCKEFGVVDEDILIEKLLEKFDFLTRDQALVYVDQAHGADS